MARVNFFVVFFFYFILFNSTFLMPLYPMNSSSKERKRKKARERENDRLTGSMLVVVYSCHGYWSMRRNRWNNVDEKEEHTCKESVRFLFTAVDFFAIDINWSDGCCYFCPSFMMYVLSSSPFFLPSHLLERIK
jgi:hypothetical protein